MILGQMARIKSWVYKCERCGHEWLPRMKDREPRVCAKCKSAYWNVPRKAAAGVDSAEMKRRAKKRKRKIGK